MIAATEFLVVGTKHGTGIGNGTGTGYGVGALNMAIGVGTKIGTGSGSTVPLPPLMPVRRFSSSSEQHTFNRIYFYAP